jgi:hypothetical protein
MVTVTRIFKVDDLDETTTEGVETVRFSAEGTNYEIDLSEANAARLREKLARFVDAAHPVTPPKAAPARRGARGMTAVVASNREHVQEIRKWAEQAGLKVSSRGRLSAEIVDQYNAAH